MKFYITLILTSLLTLSSSIIYSQEREQIPLSISPVKAFTIPANRILVGGTVEAHKSVVFSAQIPGRIVIISGEEGDHFKQGDLLVKINDDELLAKRQTAVAQFATAASAVNNAGVQFRRQIVSPSTTNNAPGGMGMPGMFDQVFTNPMASMMGTREFGVERSADIYATRARLDQAHHALKQARAQIQQIDTMLRDALSIAPFDGTIVTKNIEVGDTIQPGQRLLVYEDLDTMQIVVDVPGRHTHGLHEGQLLSARIDGLNNKLQVKVSKIFPTSDPVRHTTRVKLTLPKTTQVSPGNYAEVWIPASKSVSEKRLIVPATAVIKRGGLPSVFVVNQENRVELRLVRIGNFLASGHVVILYGVKENEQVLDKPPAFITSGYKITQ